ncbi:hypothetical protein H1Q63_10440 [Desmonostoc muscorum CCALA 125]|nr:hypothetical protein [Desmonostoc muscorum CCALA 125]
MGNGEWGMGNGQWGAEGKNLLQLPLLPSSPSSPSSPPLPTPQSHSPNKAEY